MFKSLKIIFILFIVFIGSVKTSKATHSAGMELFYRWTQDSTYQFTVIFYRNCAGFTATAPTSVGMRMSSVSGNVVSTVNLNRLPTAGTGVPPLEPPNLYNCVTGTYCTEEYVYRGNLTIPKRANDWRFSYALCCLPVTGAPTNMQNGTLYAECGLNNLDFPDTVYKTWSPFFHNRRPNHPGYFLDTVNNPPWVSICAKRDIKLSQAVRNYKGTDLRYSFFIPQTNGGNNNTYINGFSFSNPLPTANGITIDSLTGLVEFKANNPSGTGIYMLGVKAAQYDTLSILVNGNKTLVRREKGFVKRNLFIVVEDSATCPDSNTVTFKDTSSNNTITQMNLNCLDNPFKVELKKQVFCNSIDTGGSEILLINAITGDTVNIPKVVPDGCNGKDKTNGFLVYLDSALTGNMYYLMFQKGVDGNTFMTECYFELAALEDTLTLYANPPPGLGVLVTDTAQNSPDTLEVECNTTDYTVWLDVPFKCASFHSSDFIVYDLNTVPPSIEAINKINLSSCSSTMAHSVDVKMSQPLDPGYYAIALLGGVDGNRLINSCFFEFDSSALVIKVNDVSVDLGPDIYYCKNSNWDTIIGVNPTWNAYAWSNNTYTNSTVIDTAGTYWIKVWSTLGCEAMDTIEVIEVDCYIGINENEAPEISLSPNPVRDVLHIQLGNFENGMQLSVIDMSGKVMSRLIPSSANLELDVSTFKAGLYFIELSGEKEIIRREKFVVE